MKLKNTLLGAITALSLALSPIMTYSQEKEEINTHLGKNNILQTSNVENMTYIDSLVENNTPYLFTAYIHILKKNGLEIDKERECFIDELIDEAQKKIPHYEKLTPQNIHEISMKYVELIESKGVRLSSAEKSENAINNLRFDCLENTAVYVEVFTKLGYSVTMKTIDDHVFGSWDLGLDTITNEETYYNWDPTWNERTLTDQEYVWSFSTVQEADLKKNIFLKPLTTKQAISVLYTEAGVDLLGKARSKKNEKRTRMLKQARNNLEVAIAYDNENPRAYYTLAETTEGREPRQLQKKIDYLKQANEGYVQNESISYEIQKLTEIRAKEIRREQRKNN